MRDIYTILGIMHHPADMLHARWARTFGSIGKGQKGSEVTRKKRGISSGKGLYSDENKGIPSTKSVSLVQKVNG